MQQIKDCVALGRTRIFVISFFRNQSLKRKIMISYYKYDLQYDRSMCPIVFVNYFSIFVTLCEVCTGRTFTAKGFV
jgi:hypothetical protein